MPRRRSLDWFLPALCALLTAAVLASGFGLALTARFGVPLGPAPRAANATARPGALRVVALGDSITEGTGDSRGGYAARVAESLRDGGQVVIFTNLAVAGQETGEVLEVLRKPEAARELTQAHVILISAAGNDLSHGLRAPGAEAATPPEASLATARANLKRIIAELRAQNPKAAIRLLGLYNPFEVLPADAPQARAQLLTWNVAIEEAAQAHEGVVVVPIGDLFAARSDVLAGDRYHPGPRGHELIAERVLRTLPEFERERRR